MQRWTTKKPDSYGYWWALIPEDDIATIIFVLPIIYENKDYLYVDYGEDLIPLTSNMFKSWKWGSSKLTEPIGDKYVR